MEPGSLTILFFSFFFLVFLGVPISFSIGSAALLTLLTFYPLDTAIMIIALKIQSGLNSFVLLAIPFFILAGSLMNRGGIARRLINLSQVMAGQLPGSLAHVNVVANMMFGSISGSAVASAAAVGAVMTPEQQSKGYPPGFSTAINASSCPVGLLIPPSNVMIIYALVSGNVSVAALFLAGYLPGLLMGLSVMAVAALYAMKHKWPKCTKPTLEIAFRTLLAAVPSLFLIVLIMGGIIAGIFTATEASAIAVVYALILSVLVYREITLRELPTVILETTILSSVALFLIGVSSSMAWVMTNANLTDLVTSALQHVSDNPIAIMLIINLLLLVIGAFIDMTPAVLIFTPIFLPVITDAGISPLHFGIVMIFNLCIGLITPPVGNALFVSCSISGLKVQDILKPMVPIYVAMFIVLMLVTYIPALSLALPRALGFSG